MLMTRAEKLTLENQMAIMSTLSVVLHNLAVLGASDGERLLRVGLTTRISLTQHAVNTAKHLTGDKE